MQSFYLIIQYGLAHFELSLLEKVYTYYLSTLIIQYHRNN